MGNKATTTTNPAAATTDRATTANQATATATTNPAAATMMEEGKSEQDISQEKHPMLDSPNDLPQLALGVSIDTARAGTDGGIWLGTDAPERPRLQREVTAPTARTITGGNWLVKNMGKTTKVAFHNLVRQPSSFLSRQTSFHELRLTFLCNMCYCNEDVESMYCIKGGGGCAHQYCRACMNGWLTTRINEGEIFNTCPMAGVDENGCPAEVTEEDIAAVCSTEVLESFQKFQALKGPKGHLLLECPQCKSLAESRPNHAQVTCGNCQHSFCKHHGDAHQVPPSFPLTHLSFLPPPFRLLVRSLCG